MEGGGQWACYTRGFQILTLFRPGGGERILPAATVDVNTFFNTKANATKLGDFSQNLSGNNSI